MKLDQTPEYLGIGHAIYENWRAALSETHRRYHTITHIETMLSQMPEARASRELVAAIWLHDIVYAPKAKDNEQKSAARALTDLHGTAIDRQAVHSLILGTKHHEGGSDTQNILNDLDLAILGAPPAAYAQYTQQIREEYRHVPKILYKPARAAIMRQFNARQIFKTDYFQPLEAQAHANLTWEIKTLET
jgi:predicted metal-dependent HD superfamily phosphohydrolase